MKKFIIANIIAISFATNASGCALERSDHNFYMFSVFQRECMDPAFIDGINKYWKNYTGDNNNMMTEYFRWCNDKITDAARKKGDTQMQTYLKWLNLYIKTCESIKQDSWEYPTKLQITKRRQNLNTVLYNTKSYKGTRLKSQYALLRMRANMVLGNDNDNMNYWANYASKLPQSVWKEAMKNIYARALAKHNQRMKACDIYAAQGDMSSIKWIARKYRNLAGIQSIYSKAPNSPTLSYLVQDFVNNVQQTIDIRPQSKEDQEWFEMIGAKTIYKDEVNNFIAFTEKVIAEDKTSVPCLWKSASAMLQYLIGNTNKAIEDINEALAMKGTPRMKDNARAIRLLSLTANHKLTAEFSNFLVGEMKWIDTKIIDDRAGSLDFDNHYTNVKERIIFRNLAPLYIRNGKPEMATALYGMMQKYGNDFQNGATKYLDRAYGNYSDYTCRLDSMTAKETEIYFKFISKSHKDCFEQYVTERVYKDNDFFNEMIGTKYIAEGKFESAESYLAKVSQKFIDGQRINFYMSQRSYSVERWFERQRPKNEEGFLYTDFADVYGKSNGNQKLMFCKDMLSLISQYNITKPGEEKEVLAYKLATRFYQASHYGDCWYLTHYGQSVSDTARTNEMDFVATAIKYLDECKQSKNLTLRYKAVYALAFIPVQPWYTIDYDSDFNEILRPVPKARQYMAMSALESFSREHPDIVDNYTTKCDMLRKFKESR